MDIKEQIKSSISISDVVSLYVDLKPAGKYFKALCPFHTEKTPSFFVMPDKDIFTCYGCNKFGDIFTFIQEIENLTFIEAQNYLIERFNLPIKKDSASYAKGDEYVRLNELAIKHFKSNLSESEEGQKALIYLEKRGIKTSTIEQFSLGYAKNSWDGLYRFFRQHNVDLKTVLNSGLLIKGNQQKIYDRFRGRIIFPIYSETGIPIAFGGRTIFDDNPKYLNSPDTPIYKKSKFLYGFHLAKKNIRESNSAILVEGYFDMISVFQQGFTNVVASLGTALTEEQIYLLKRFARNLYIFYDNDKAGISASFRGIDKMLELNVIPRIISISCGGDPDDFIRKEGPKALKQEIENSLDGIRYMLEKVDMSNRPEVKAEEIKKIVQIINRISDPILREEYLHIAADYFNLEISFLKSNNAFLSEITKTTEIGLPPAEIIFLETIIAFPAFIKEIKNLFNDELLSVLKTGKMIESILKNYDENLEETELISRITKSFTDPEKKIMQILFEKKDIVRKNQIPIEERIASSFIVFQDMLNKRKSAEIDRKIRKAEKENNEEEIIRLMNQKFQFKKNIYNLIRRDI